MKGYNPRFLKMRGKVQDIVVTQMGDLPVVRGRAFTNDSNSPRQRSHRTSFGGYNSAFKNLGPILQDGWLVLSEKVQATRRAPLSPQNCYVMINSALAAARLPTTDTAPAAIDTPAPITGVTLTTTGGPVHDPSFVLEIHSDDDWDGPVLVLGYAPQLVSFSRYEKLEPVPLGVLPSLPSGATDVSALFIGRFGQPAAGTKIALSLVRVSPNGFKSRASFVGAPFLPGDAAAGTEGLHAA